MEKIAVLGFGTVGSGTVELFYKNKKNIEKKAGKELDIQYILDLRDFAGSPYASKLVKDIQAILDDPEITVVAEAMGGLHPAFEYTRECLSRGKSVVTSNKELVAAKGAELLQVAKEHHCNFFFEASVGGAIPIIRPIHQCLAANDLAEIVGILNGTTNFILTKMITENMTFYDALAIAQQLGYAENDPTADVEGHDTCRKICILASLAFGRHVYPEQVHTEGISSITLEDVAYANNWGGEIKLLGRVQKFEDGRVLPIVCPEFVSRTSQLSTVDDVFNAIMVKGDAIDKVMFYGRGAGKFPTASAMVADVIEAVKACGTIQSQIWEDGRGQDFVMDYQEAKAAKYVRIFCESRDDAISVIKSVFGEVQYLTRKNREKTELAFITPVMTEAEMAKKLKTLDENGVEVKSSIRVLDCSWNSLA